MHAHPNPLIQMLHAALLQPRQPRLLCFQVPEWGLRVLQLQVDICTSIVPKDFRVLGGDVQEVINVYFHRVGGVGPGGPSITRPRQGSGDEY